MIEEIGKHYLYRHIRLDKNEVFYVGVGTKKKWEYNRAKSKWGHNKIWWDIIRKSDQKYKVEILLHSNNYDFILEKEKEFIKLYGRKNLGTGTLANLTDGGEGFIGYKKTKEQIEKRRATMKGRPSPLRGKKLSEETKKKISLSKEGMVLSKESILKRQKTKLERAKERGFYQSEEHKRNIGLANGRKVLQYDMNMNFIAKYPSTAEAGRQTNILSTKIGQVALGKRKSAGGFKWKYEEDYKTMSINEI